MKAIVAASALLALATPSRADIKRDPNGVNVNAHGATTVLITFGGLRDQRPAEGLWCGELVSAAPDTGMRCDPSTIFGSLPGRHDQSRLAPSGTFTDIMSIPPSVARRAYQAAERGATSSFYYVRRFASTAGGPDEYVFVTCRMAGGGARVPLSLVDVLLSFEDGATVAHVKPDAALPAVTAALTYNGTGRLKGRWEVVMPGEELPDPRDLLTEASLPAEERARQRRYTVVAPFNVFLPPTGRHVLPGPDPDRLPRRAAGQYRLLFRVEASDDKEADSSLERAGAGTGILHAGAVAGFPMPTLRYLVGNAPAAPRVELSEPADGATLPPGGRPTFVFTAHPSAAAHQVEVETDAGSPALTAPLPSGMNRYVAPAWLGARGPRLRWRVLALDADGATIDGSAWRELRVAPPASAPATTPARP